MKKLDSVTGISVFLLFLILLPALFYSAYELNSLSTSEEMFGEIYTRQLDAILFSVNQHAWDVVNNWANIISSPGNDLTFAKKDSLHRSFVLDNPSIQALFFCDTIGNLSRIVRKAQSTVSGTLDTTALILALKQNAEKLARIVRYNRTGYRKLESLYLGGSLGLASVAIVIPTNEEGNPAICGFVLDDTAFVKKVLSRKLADVAGSEFILAVVSRRTGIPLVNTGAVPVKEFRQKKALWLFPDLELAIRLNGITVEEVVRSRAQRNILLILILDAVLLAGAWFVYRGIRREMELVRLKSDFVSNVSHELRTPLALIRMFGETLEMGRVNTDAKRQEYYSTIVKESERLTRLVNNILDFSKMEAGKKQYHFHDVQLNDVASAVISTYKYHLQSEGFLPIVELDTLLPEVQADSEAVAEAVVNLVDNAIKYSGDQRVLHVRTKRIGLSAAIEIEDRGFGIAKEYHEKIFETFFRVSSGLVHNTKGSGLGLALVKHIMEAHRGTIEVESEPGKGSTFRLLFPVKS